mmetsp:Transcript_41380/g.101966  ORF Transcript_41380/g.101966 Transcript_41380/m.101966 type:complete len:243 (+) Transcript_41380:1081-1809(+)
MPAPYTAAVPASAASARSNAPKGSAREEGTRRSVTPSALTLAPRAARLELLPPTMPGAYISCVTIHSSEFLLGVSCRRSATAAVVAPPAEVRALVSIITSSPTTLSLTPLPAMAVSAAHPAGSVMAASMTPTLRARMAMWLSRSTGAEVITAVTPGGMSSRPPRRSDRTTVGVALRSWPCSSSRDCTTHTPAWTLRSGLPALMSSQAERPAAVRTWDRTSPITLDTANMEWPRTTSSPKLAM